MEKSTYCPDEDFSIECPEQYCCNFYVPKFVRFRPDIFSSRKRYFLPNGVSGIHNTIQQDQHDWPSLAQCTGV